MQREKGESRVQKEIMSFIRKKADKVLQQILLRAQSKIDEV
jgi:hypothetical protein